MTRSYSKLAMSAFVLLCCAAAIFSHQGSKKVTVTLVRWPYT